MTELVYYQDQYKRELETKILKVEKNQVLLAETIFIPQTNTEPGDSGKINNMKISSSRKSENDIWHVFPKHNPFNEGDTVNLKLNWDRRLLIMKLHSALHLSAGPFDKNFGKRAVAGIVKKNTGELVFKEGITDEIINEALKLINKEIETGLEIISYWDKKREGFRWTQIGDYPPIPDGGLHVNNTNEIGRIKLLNNKFDEGKQKLEITVE